MQRTDPAPREESKTLIIEPGGLRTALQRIHAIAGKLFRREP
jgi:hypothetical protein